MPILPAFFEREMSQYHNITTSTNRIFTYFYTDEEVNGIFWPVTEWISQNLPDGAVIAVKDHGKITYFTQVQVVDLAGIIDPSLVSHVKEGTMRAYLEERDVEYILIPRGAGGYVFNSIWEAAKEAKVEEIAGFPGGSQLFHILSYD